MAVGWFLFLKHSCSHFHDAMKYSVKLETRETCLQTVVLEGNMEILKRIIFLSLSLG